MLDSTRRALWSLSVRMAVPFLIGVGYFGSQVLDGCNPDEMARVPGAEEPAGDPSDPEYRRWMGPHEDRSKRRNPD